MAIISTTLSVKSLKWERASTQAAMRSAQAAERANELMVQQLSHPAPTTQEAPITTDITLIAEHPSKNRWVLRNTGSSTAYDVTVEPLPDGVITRQLPDGITLHAGQGADMLLLGTWGSPVPNQVWVTWRGQPDPVAVALST